jgi:anti-sigma-K factor RskA
MGKKLWQSKTFWFNALSAAATVLAALAASPEIAANPKIAAFVAAGGYLVNVVLRTVTSEPIEA